MSEHKTQLLVLVAVALVAVVAIVSQTNQHTTGQVVDWRSPSTQMQWECAKFYGNNFQMNDQTTDYQKARLFGCDLSSPKSKTPIALCSLIQRVQNVGIEQQGIVYGLASCAGDTPIFEEVDEATASRLYPKVFKEVKELSEIRYNK